IANVTRKHLLASHGGVWVDATLLPTQPLDQWLTDPILEQGFFAFRSGGDTNLVLQNWFLASDPGNELMVAWSERYANYFSSRRIFPTWKRCIRHGAPLQFIRYHRHLRARDTRWFADPNGGMDCPFYPYAISNYCFSQMLHEQPDLAKKWAKVPARWAFAPLAIGAASRDPETPPKNFFAAAEEMLSLAPVHKLNSRDERFVHLLQVAREVAGLS
ncbi:MAG: capsular polysaccharide synthesis protein, partial [Pseudomonadota bacterium]